MDGSEGKDATISDHQDEMFDFVQPPFAGTTQSKVPKRVRKHSSTAAPARYVVDPCDPVKLYRDARWCYPPFSTFECGNKMAVSQAGVCRTTHVACLQNC
jgi:hypothetical protein